VSNRLCDVVIPTRNRPEALERCLRALADQSARDFGIIIVDDHSDEPLDEVVAHVVATETFQSEPTLIRLDEQSGPSAARNAGVAASSAEYVVFIDDDVVADRHLINVHLTEVTSTTSPEVPVITRGPFVEPVDWRPSAWSLWEARMATKGTNSVLRGDYVPSCRHFHTGNNCISVALFRQAGGFDETYKRLEDDEFGLRLDELGCKLHFVPAALAWHYPDRSLEAWLKIPRAYAYYTVMLDRRYPSYGYLADEEGALSRKNALLRIARSLLTGRRRTPVVVHLAARVGCLAHRLRLTPITLAMMSLAYDLNFSDALRQTLASQNNDDAR
jgi:GT2 family glycosyltransferase